MINDISNGIAKAIYNEFGEGYAIYDEDIQQDLKEPCFYILPLIPMQKQIIGTRYRRNMPFDVHYFPQSKIAPKAEMNDVSDRLFEVLEYIENPNGKKVRGLSMSVEQVDNVLHFYVTYTMSLKKITEEEQPMNSLAYGETSVSQGGT